MNITELFFQAAATYPERLAIVESGRAIDYRTLAAEVRATAAYFLRQGIQRGDRVLVFVPMSIDLYRIVLALFYVGATAVFLDAWVSRARLRVCCAMADCRGFIGVWKARLYAWITPVLRRIPIHLRLRGRAETPVAPTDLTPDAPALITFTTGSTGAPKAAERTHGFLRAQFAALLTEINPQPTDVDLPTLPILLFVNLGVGCTSIIADYKRTRPDKLRPERIIHQLQQHRVSRLTASPYFVRRVAEALLAEGTTLPGLQKVFTGGAPVFPAEARLYLTAFAKAKTTIVYGSTEAEPISSIPADALAKTAIRAEGLPVGVPFEDILLKIIPISTDPIVVEDQNALTQLALPEGEIGEIIVAGAHVNARYFRNPAAFRANKITAGDTVWHRTGDSGFLRNGQLYLTGRCGQLIRRNGKWLAPFLIERQLQTLPGITAGTLLEIADQLVLVVESRESAPVVDVDFSYDRLVVLSRLPRDPRHHSKLDYAALANTVRSGTL